MRVELDVCESSVDSDSEEGSSKLYSFVGMSFVPSLGDNDGVLGVDEEVISGNAVGT